MRILLVEDEHQLARNIQRYLLLEHCAVDVFFNGEEGLQKALQEEYDCIVLDVNLPKMDGFAICQELRLQHRQVPILLLTALSEKSQVVQGLNTGADDYLTKPFDMEELLARIRTLTRRSSSNKSPEVRIGDVCVNTNTKIVLLKGERITLSPKEYAILEYLLKHTNRVLERSQIISHVWGTRGDELQFSQTLDVHIAYLRKKIGKGIITTVPSIGYMIESDV